MIFSVSIVFSGLSQSVPNYLSSNGLIGYWPFNGNANDESGNNNNGSVNGATLTTDRKGNFNSAYSFNGSSNNIAPGKNNLPLNTSSRSVSIWFQRIGNGGCLLSYGNASNSNAYMISITSSIISNQGWADDFPVYPSIDNNWHHLVCTFESGVVKIYLDAVLLGTGSKPNWNTINSSFYFGTRVLNDMDFFNGKLDDVAIWNRVLTQEEISSIYSETPLCSNPTAIITPQGSTSFCEGGNVILKVTSGLNYSYQWYKNGQTINNAVISEYIVTTTGSYTIKVKDGGCSTTSSAIDVTVNSNPTVSINSLNEVFYKTSNSVQLSGSPSGGSFVGEAISSSVFNPSECTLGKKKITYNYTTEAGCSGVASKNIIMVDSVGNVCSSIKYDTVTVTNTILKYDTITVTNTIVIYDTLEVNKTIYDTIVINQTINDTVDVLLIKVKITSGTFINSIASISVYPNPTSDLLIIETEDLSKLENYSIKIVDLQGKEFFNSKISNSKTQISLSTLVGSGVYLLQVLDIQGNISESRKIVLTN